MNTFLAASVPHVLQIPWWAWVGFLVFITLMLALDLGLFHKKDRVLPFKEAAVWCAVWGTLAGVFAAGLGVVWGKQEAEIFAAGYLLEIALSVDNLFVFLLVFSFFKVPDTLQHRVLFWGILGAVFMRAIFIFGGVTLVERFGFLMYVFGAFLIFTGLKMALPEKTGERDLEKNFLVRLGRRIFPLTPELRGRHFLVREGGRWMATPLLLVLLVIEGTDVLFAVDSIPAVMGVLPPEMSSQGKLFIAFTSNIFAILGLRSLFFALAGLMKFFRHLKTGLAFILAFIGAKMVLTEAGLVHIPTWVSLAVLAGALAVSVGVSVWWKRPAK